ncbi:MAG TPA: hypothetical protein DEP23_00515 [Ruminococcaceae bacterium]|nr:hypothetical protein [Oscillospiraceae bacterium]
MNLIMLAASAGQAMDIEFKPHNITESLVLMLMGMVGIFVVMAVILGLIVILNKATDEKKAQARKEKRQAKKAAKAQLKDNMRSI